MHIIIFLSLAGCQDRHKYWQKEEIEKIGIMLPISTECLHFNDESNNRVRICKEWVLCAKSPFIFSPNLSLTPDKYNWDKEIIIELINSRVGEKIIHTNDFEKKESGDITQADGVEIRMTHVICKRQYLLHVVFIKL